MGFGKALTLLAAALAWTISIAGIAIVGISIIKLFIVLVIAFPYVSLTTLSAMLALGVYRLMPLTEPSYPPSHREDFRVQVNPNQNENEKQKELNQNLLEACYNLEFPKIRQAVEAGASLDAKDNENNTPLHIICLKISNRFLPNFSTIITYLLEMGANPFTLNGRNHSAFHLILNKGLHNIFALFKKTKHTDPQGLSIYNSPLQTPGDERKTPLTAVIQNILSAADKKLFLETLLECGADPNLPALIAEAMDGNHHSTPLIGLFYLLKKAIADNADDNTLNIIHATCLSFLARGANPLAKITIEYYESYSMKRKHKMFLTEEALPDHPLMNDIVQRANRILDESGKIDYSVSEGVVLSQDEKLLNKTITEAIQFQKALPGSNALTKLIDLFIRKPNIKAIECLVNLVTPETSGYAHLCRELANQYLGSATIEFDETVKENNVPDLDPVSKTGRDITLLDDKPEKQKAVIEYRRLCLLYCLKGSFSKEKDPAAQKIKQHLQWQLEKYMKDWERKDAVNGLQEKSEDDIFEITSTKLVEATCVAAALHKLQSQQAKQAKATAVNENEAPGQGTTNSLTNGTTPTPRLQAV